MNNAAFPGESSVKLKALPQIDSDIDELIVKFKGLRVSEVQRQKVKSDIFCTEGFKKLNGRTVFSSLKELGLNKRKIVLGSGGFGCVERWCKNRKRFAVKIINKEKYPNHESGINQDLALYKGEVCSLNFGNHPNLVKVHSMLLKKIDGNQYAVLSDTGALPDDEKKNYHIAAVISDEVEGKELWELLDNKKVVLNSRKAVDISKDVANALDYLHGLGYVYRDLKSENIIYNTETEKVCLIDYGFVKHIGRGRTRSFKGTRPLVAPEVWQAKYDPAQGYDFSYDAWMLGCLLLEFITRKSPGRYRDYKNDMEESFDDLDKDYKKSKKCIEAFAALNDESKSELLLKYNLVQKLLRYFEGDLEEELISITIKLLRTIENNRLTVSEAKKQLTELSLKIKQPDSKKRSGKRSRAPVEQRLPIKQAKK